MQRRISLLELISQQTDYRQNAALMEKRMKVIGDFADSMQKIREMSYFTSSHTDIKER
ncbi:MULTISPECIES: hypothetical protein [unclassified Duganella]|jgi:hypothetical protein|uniref:hypothetical protein n=1 Tax=unclassified Duganella TaxID=2636909 RepID=UPI000880464A|nr:MULTISPECIES: hypothetical protein [unclassified Duganella]SDG16440.1 hypothetical protein SAMN05216320_103106 [Duganella sp. OV458]SDJ31494.1 hypothetical protein SAMN05428973_103380 [Duganella sp. OV510]